MSELNPECAPTRTSPTHSGFLSSRRSKCDPKVWCSRPLWVAQELDYICSGIGPREHGLETDHVPVQALNRYSRVVVCFSLFLVGMPHFLQGMAGDSFKSA